MTRSGSGVVVVIPAYQEAANLAILLDGVFSALPDAHVLIVDDASGDGTPELVRAHARFGTALFLAERAGKSGFASALGVGHRWALERDAEVIVQMDADLSHDPGDLPLLLDALEAGADLAVGSRYCPGGGIEHWSRWRLLLSRAAGFYVRAWTGLPLHDPTAGFRAFRAGSLRSALATPKHCDGYGFQVEVAHAVWTQQGTIREVPVIFSERREGGSKLSSRIVWEAILRVPFLRAR